VKSLSQGFTLIEIVTTLVVATVLGAIAVVMWRSHALRERRDDGVRALLAVQTAQDAYFGEHARYASAPQLSAPLPTGPGLHPKSRLGYYAITVRNSADNLGYSATARAIPRAGETEDLRCVELRIDQNGRRSAVDSKGEDRSADCWH
jgi:prepilin-type N-terminal cleavage/methylation domain-containing protein